MFHYKLTFIFIYCTVYMNKLNFCIYLFLEKTLLKDDFSTKFNPVERGTLILKIQKKMVIPSRDENKRNTKNKYLVQEYVNFYSIYYALTHYAFILLTSTIVTGLNYFVVITHLFLINFQFDCQPLNTTTNYSSKKIIYNQ